jgi:hypothetical protein
MVPRLINYLLPLLFMLFMYSSALYVATRLASALPYSRRNRELRDNNWDTKSIKEYALTGLCKKMKP